EPGAPPAHVTRSSKALSFRVPMCFLPSLRPPPSLSAIVPFANRRTNVTPSQNPERITDLSAKVLILLFSEFREGLLWNRSTPSGGKASGGVATPLSTC